MRISWLPPTPPTAPAPRAAPSRESGFVPWRLSDDAPEEIVAARPPGRRPKPFTSAEVRRVASCYPQAQPADPSFSETYARSERTRYFTFSQIRVTTLIFPSPENGAADPVNTNLSPSLRKSLTTVVPVHTSFQEMSM